MINLNLLTFSTNFFVAVVQSLSRVHVFVTPWTAACQAPPLSTISRSLLKFMSVELVMPSNHLILCCPLLLFFAFNLSQHQGLFLLCRLDFNWENHLPVGAKVWCKLRKTLVNGGYSQFYFLIEMYKYSSSNTSMGCHFDSVLTEQAAILWQTFS